ncbi:MAG: chemotaxis protein CheC [Candidatus Cloacimonadota bacterium]|nr:MAG: chemotaxis protein CheC [Candidatus Cloacimonadota bacterium]
MISLNEEQLDALNEVINIGVGTAINSLNDLVQSYIKLSIPKIEFIQKSNLPKHLSANRYSIVVQSFTGSFEGVASLVFDHETAKKLVAKVLEMPIDNPLLDTSINETLSEIGNIIINSLIGHISNILHTSLHFSLPIYTSGNIKELSKHFYLNDDDDLLLVATTKFQIQSLEVEGVILLSFPSQSIQSLLNLIFSSFENNE